MKKYTKLLTLFCALTMAAGMISGCGGGKAPGGANNENTASTSSGELPDLDTSKEVELVMYVVSDRPAMQDEIDANYNEIFKEKLNCTLKLNWLGWAEFSNKYPLLFSSGEKFDMAYCATWLNYSSLAQKGAFKALDELWPKYAPNNYAKQSETALQQAKVDGVTYCIPTLVPTYSAYGPYYRTDLVEGTGWDGVMENFEDLEEYLGFVKEAAPEIEPLNMYQAGSEVSCVWLQSKGYFNPKDFRFLYWDPNEENPQIKVIYEEENLMEFLEMMKRWNEAGFFPKSALSDTDSQKVQNGKAACGIHNIDTYEGIAIQRPEWKFKYANFVSDVSNLPFTQDAMVISNTSANPERALALYDLITSDEEAFRAFYYGIENTSYEIIDGQVKMLNPDNYAASACWAARTKEFYLPTYGSPEDVQTLKTSFDEYIEGQGGKGCQMYQAFVINTTEVETELAACKNVVQQYWNPLELAYTDLESGLAEFQTKMEAAGIDKLVENFQKQLDAYVASLGD